MTIFGESAGSIASHLLVLSPMAKGLFHGAILQSGTALSVAAGMDSGNTEKNSMRLLEALECGSGYRAMQCIQVTRNLKRYMYKIS